MVRMTMVAMEGTIQASVLQSMSWSIGSIGAEPECAFASLYRGSSASLTCTSEDGYMLLHPAVTDPASKASCYECC